MSFSKRYISMGELCDLVKGMSMGTLCDLVNGITMSDFFFSERYKNRQAV